MGLDPGDDIREKVLADNFNGGSPYFGMYHAGYYGVPLDEVLNKCRSNGISIRSKDIANYNNGVFARGMGNIVRGDKLVNIRDIERGIPFTQMKLCDFPMFPPSWVGTERRFFPCSMDNRPLQKWGWTRDYTPQLYNLSDAKALSPCGWVGQNMLYQRFIVLDIDGRGHGEDDPLVIEFGNRWKDRTRSYEDPAKPGSFHLYFETDRLIPVRHFTWAKLDLMGNAVNAAVYLKNKRSNGKDLLKLDEEIWHEILVYQQQRKGRP